MCLSDINPTHNPNKIVVNDDWYRCFSSKGRFTEKWKIYGKKCRCISSIFHLKSCNKIIYRHSTNQITDFWRCRFTRSYFWYFDFISTKDTHVISCSLLFSLYSLQRWLFQYLYGQNLTNDRPPNGVRINVNNTMHRPVNGKMIPPALRRNGLPKLIGKHSVWQSRIHHSLSFKANPWAKSCCEYQLSSILKVDLLTIKHSSFCNEMIYPMDDVTHPSNN